MEELNFNYNVALNTINCINDINYTYHIIWNDYPVLHTHTDYFEFTIILDGEILNIRNGSQNKISKNSLLISGPKDNHLLKKNTNNIKLLNIMVRSNELDKLLDTFPIEFKSFFDKFNVYELSDDLMHIITDYIDRVNAVSAKDWRLTNDLLKSCISVVLNYIFLKSNENISNEKNKYDKFIEKLNDLKANVRFFTLGVNDLTYELGVSRTHLNRIFYELYNESPHDYLLKSKMEYAAQLLEYTDYSIKEISNLTGYSSSSQFSNNFKEIYNMTPYEYKKKK